VKFRKISVFPTSGRSEVGSSSAP